MIKIPLPSKIPTINIETLGLAFFIITPVVYFWFRYPFKIAVNIPYTGYIDTPFSLKIAKYLIITTFSILYLYKTHNSSKISQRIIPLSILAYLALHPLILGITQNNLYYIKVAFIFLTPLIITTIDFKKINLTSITSTLKILLWLLLLANIIIIFLYIQFERLPAHTYSAEMHLRARFGSLLEDPNAFGLALIFFFFFVIFQKKSYLKWVTFILTTISIILTQSLTALIALTLTYFVHLIHSKQLSNIRSAIAFSVIIACTFSILIIIGENTIKSAIIDLALQKEESIKIHLGHITGTITTQYTEIFIAESGLRNIYHNIGGGYLFCLATFIIFHLTMILSRIRKQGFTHTPPIIIASAYFVISTLIAAIGLPIENMFSVSTFLGIFLGLLISYSYSPEKSES